jgi:hypothetical protein
VAPVIDLTPLAKRARSLVGADTNDEWTPFSLSAIDGGA